MTRRLRVRNMLDDLTVAASDQDVTVGTAGKIIIKIHCCIVCIVQQE